MCDLYVITNCFYFKFIFWTFHFNWYQTLFHAPTILVSLSFRLLAYLYAWWSVSSAALFRLRLRPLFGLWLGLFLLTLNQFLSWFHFLFWWLHLILLFGNLAIYVFLILLFWGCCIPGFGLLLLIFLLGRGPTFYRIGFFLFFRFRAFRLF